MKIAFLHTWCKPILLFCCFAPLCQEPSWCDRKRNQGHCTNNLRTGVGLCNSKTQVPIIIYSSTRDCHFSKPNLRNIVMQLSAKILLISNTDMRRKQQTIRVRSCPHNVRALSGRPEIRSILQCAEFTWCLRSKNQTMLTQSVGQYIWSQQKQPLPRAM